jgi:hypothetical protein
LNRTRHPEIEEGASSALYFITSHPFEISKTGKFAAKFINHHGDEVSKVYPVR